MSTPKLIASISIPSVICLVVGFLVGRSVMPDPLVVDVQDEGGKPEPQQFWSNEKVSKPEKETTSEGDDDRESGDEEIASTENSDYDVAVLPTSALELISAQKFAVPGENLFEKDDSIIDVLAIDDKEKAKLQTAYRQIGERLKSQEAEATEVMKNEDGTVSLSVPPMEQARTSARSRFQSDVLSTLGEDRGKVFLAVKQQSSMFGEGGSPKDYLVEMESVGDGNYRYRVSEMDGDQRRVFVGNSIPERLRHLTNVAKIVPVLETPDEEEEE